jgi:hypothetical protein
MVYVMSGAISICPIFSLKETVALLESNAQLDYSEMLIQHPLLGKNNVPGLLRFLALHERRHQRQMKEIMSSSQFLRLG